MTITSIATLIDAAIDAHQRAAEANDAAEVAAINALYQNDADYSAEVDLALRLTEEANSLSSEFGRGYEAAFQMRFDEQAIGHRCVITALRTLNVAGL